MYSPKGKPRWLRRPSFTQATASPAIASTTTPKCLGRIECTSMSGAGFVKSMAYATPSLIANSTEFMS